MLAITVRQALQDRYGATGYKNIRTALQIYAAEANAEVVALDDADDMSNFGLAPALGSQAGSLLLALRAVRKVVNPVESILLVGGNDIVPHCQIPNPVSDRNIDEDEFALSDNPYGTESDTLADYLAPPMPVGRLTDFPRGSADDFVQLIDAATANRRTKAARSRAAAMVDIDWADFSRQAATPLPTPVDWYFSPGSLLDHNRSANIDRAFLYFNLHGFPDIAEWQGYDSVQEKFVVAVTPDAFDRRYVSGTVVFAENCYGAKTGGRTPSNCCALRLVREGAVFIGATGLAYGSHVAPNFFLDDADALARNFWSQFLTGAEVGEALRRARAEYLNDANTPVTNPFKQKTLLQFILLGDPGWS